MAEPHAFKERKCRRCGYYGCDDRCDVCLVREDEHPPAPVPTDVLGLREAAQAVVDVWAEARAADMLPAIERLIAALAASPDAPRDAGLESLLLAVEEVDNAWHDEGDHLEYHEELAERLLTLRAEYTRFSDIGYTRAARLSDIGDTAAPATSTEDGA